MAQVPGTGVGHTGYKSKAQWRYFFVNPKLKRWAHQKAHATPGPPKVRFRRLPDHSSLAGRLGVGRSLRTAKGFKSRNKS